MLTAKLARLGPRLAPRLGLDTTPVGPGAWLLRRTTSEVLTRPLAPKAGVGHLVYHPRRARRHLPVVQRQLTAFLLEEQVSAILRALEVNCVLDVGANVGQFGRTLRHGGYRGRIVSFEPVAEFATKLRRRAAQDHDWHVREYALGDEETTAEINATPGASLSSLLPASDFGKEWSTKLERSVKQEITIRRLDAVLDEVLDGIADPRVYLKLDTQGFDLPAFRGAGDRLPEIAAMQSEVSCLPIYEGMPQLEEALGEYRAAGFDLAGMFPVSMHRPTLRVLEFDAVLVRQEAFSASRA
jgi:FkbM family methyltransferase